MVQANMSITNSISDVFTKKFRASRPQAGGHGWPLGVGLTARAAEQSSGPQRLAKLVLASQLRRALLDPGVDPCCGEARWGAAVTPCRWDPEL